MTVFRLMSMGRLNPELLMRSPWESNQEKAREISDRIASWAKNVVVLNEPTMEAKTRHLAARCTELRNCIENNEDALIGLPAVSNWQADLDSEPV